MHSNFSAKNCKSDLRRSGMIPTEAYASPPKALKRVVARVKGLAGLLD